MRTPSDLTPAAPAPPWLAALGLSTRYEALELIGQGGMGEVWKARDLKTGEIVALKTVTPARAGDTALLTRAELESEALNMLIHSGGHPAVVRIIDFTIDDQHSCLVMEYVDGCHLLHWLISTRPDIRQRVAMIARIAEGLAFCHKLKIIHRDIKPQNIHIRTGTESPVIVDFSVSKCENQLPHTLTSEHPGTFPYMAPEQLNSARGLTTTASDVYGLGATVYELLTNVLPHPGSHAQVIERHINEISPAPPRYLNPAVPEELQWIVLKCLSYRPSDRYENAGEMAADLNRWLMGKAVHARPCGLFTCAVRKIQKHRPLAAALAAIVVALLWIGWREWTGARHRELEEMRQTIIDATENASWTVPRLDQLMGVLERIGERNPLLKEELLERLVRDVKSDAFRTLESPRLTQADEQWIRSITPWLACQRPSDAREVSQSLESRLTRWEITKELSPPFANLNDVVLQGTAEVIGNSLRARVKARDEKNVPLIPIKPSCTVPMEIRATFLCAKNPVKGPGIRFNWADTSLAASVEPTHREGTDGAEIKIVHGNEVPQTFFIPDPEIWEGPVTLVAQLQQRMLQVIVNDRWTLEHEEDFVLIPESSDCHLAVTLPRTAKLKSLTMLAPRMSSPSRLEEGDELAAAGNWAKAQKYYESMRGHREVEHEVAYKLGMTLYRQRKTAEALAIWEKLASSEDDYWQCNALCRLWVHYATTKSISEARPYLVRLPSPNDIPWPYNLPPDVRQSLRAAYHTSVRGLNLLKYDLVAIDDAVRVFRFTEADPLLIAARFTMPRHMAGMDNTAHDLLRTALQGDALEHARQGTLSVGDQSLALFTLDLWLQITRASADSELREALNNWNSALNGIPGIKAMLVMEDAREAARTGNVQLAMKKLIRVPVTTGLNPMNTVNLHLLKSVVHQKLNQPKEAEACANDAYIACEPMANVQSWMSMSAEMTALTLTSKWTPAAATRLTGHLFGMSRPGPSGMALQERIGSPMLDTPRYAELLNEAVKDPAMLEFLHSAVLRTVPASEVMRSWCHVLLKNFWIATTRDPSPAVRALYTRLTDEVFAAFADRAMDEGDLVTFLEAWQEPSGNHDIQPFLHRLTQSSRQVFEQAMTARLAQFNATASGAR